jgi:hypothetical protein
MKKICIAIGLIMAINTSWAQVSVDDDYFPAFVEAQNSLAREKDSLNNLKLLSRVEKFDNVKVVVETPKPVEKPKVIETPKVVKKQTPKPIVVKVEPVVEVEKPKPVREPLNQYYIEDNYQITGNSVFSENYLAGIKFDCSLRNKTYLLFKLVKKNVGLNNPNRLGDYFTGTYFVPITWWNENNVSGSLTYEQIEYIKDNFQIKYKNED